MAPPPVRTPLPPALGGTASHHGTVTGQGRSPTRRDRPRTGRRTTPGPLRCRAARGGRRRRAVWQRPRASSHFPGRGGRACSSESTPESGGSEPEEDDDVGSSLRLLNLSGDLDELLGARPVFRPRLHGYDRLQVDNYVRAGPRTSWSPPAGPATICCSGSPPARPSWPSTAHQAPVAAPAELDLSAVSERVREILRLASAEADAILEAAAEEADRMVADARPRPRRGCRRPSRSGRRPWPPWTGCRSGCGRTGRGARRARAGRVEARNCCAQRPRSGIGWTAAAAARRAARRNARARTATPRRRWRPGGCWPCRRRWPTCAGSATRRSSRCGPHRPDRRGAAWRSAWRCDEPNMVRDDVVRDDFREPNVVRDDLPERIAY